ncbi:phage tail assembly chaperone [Pseudomonas aeruginosa]|uniref:phage tail assembly chaperone n=1 Tax=Pseudomonas aeruginosa TaxID=287 RepID=UPI0032B5FCE9
MAEENTKYNEKNIEWARARAVRDAELKRSDPLVLQAYEAGAPVADDVKAYRQALRDLPETFDDPADIVWPKAPASMN